MSNPTRVQQLKSTLKTEFEAMTVANGYNNTFSKVTRAMPHPRDVQDPLLLSYYVGKREFQKLSDSRELFTKDLNVSVQVVQLVSLKDDDENSQADQMQELLINDLERKISSFMTSYINHATNPWNVSFDKEPLCQYPSIITDKDITRVAVVFEFMIKLRRLKGATD